MEKETKRAKNWTEEEYQIVVDYAYIMEGDHKSDLNLAKEIRHRLPERSLNALKWAFTRDRTFLYGSTIGKDKYIHVSSKHVIAMQKRYDPAFIQKRIKENEKHRMKEQRVKNPRSKKRQTEKQSLIK
jgi:hypothetical protein